jgi:aminocarboxymuconate-semialdehyde decarboxylase
VAGRLELDDAGLAPFWEAAAALEVPVFIHPHDVAGAGRMPRYHLRNLVGNPLETALAAAALIFGGVLRRYPRLDVLLSHGGGALPWLLGRLDHGFEVRVECRGIDRPPSEWARRFLYDTVVFKPSILRTLVEWIGADRVVLGTDFPFDMSDPHPVGTVHEALRDPDARRALLEGNAWRLLARTHVVPRPAHLPRTD